jgi:alanine-glyoxylate transaminase/serine-glyoxylate transaminase/serine-pyruvate transaminase
MTLASGRSYIAIPGPSVMPDRVLQAMHRPGPDIYSTELADMTAGVLVDLKRLAGTRHQLAAYIANGHGVWEGALANMAGPGDRVLVLNSGAFAAGWAEVATRMGIDAEVMDFGLRAPVDPVRVAERLSQDSAHHIKAVLMVQVDTASSVLNDIKAVRGALDGAEHPAIFMVDAMASFGCERFEMDALGVDVTTAGSQKGLMTPAGMGFIWFNDKADAARPERVSPYWDWRPRANPEEYYRTFFGTAPTHHLYGLRAAVDMILEEGIEAVWHRHEVLARAIWAACEAWGAGNGSMRLNIQDPGFRAHSVTALGLADGSGTALREWLSQNAGVTLGVGLGMAPPDDPEYAKYFRIGHMGHVNAHMVLGVLGAMDAGMKALGVTHGAGAIEAAAGEISKG